MARSRGARGVGADSSQSVEAVTRWQACCPRPVAPSSPTSKFTTSRPDNSPELGLLDCNGEGYKTALVTFAMQTHSTTGHVRNKQGVGRGPGRMRSGLGKRRAGGTTLPSARREGSARHAYGDRRHVAHHIQDVLNPEQECAKVPLSRLTGAAEVGSMGVRPPARKDCARQERPCSVPGGIGQVGGVSGEIRG